MGGMVAQLLYRRHASLLSGLVLCSTACSVGESPAEKLAALALPTLAAALRWNPILQLVTAEALGMALVGHIDDPATGRWAHAQLSRTTLAAAVSAIQAVCEFTSDGWVSQVDVPTAVAMFPREVMQVPRSAVERKFDLRRWTTMQHGGHFAAMEQPDALIDDIRAFCREFR